MYPAAAFAVRLTRLGNLLFLAALLLGLLASFTAPTLLTAGLFPETPPADLPAALTGARWLLLLGLALATALAVLLPALEAPLDALHRGAPFQHGLAARLRTAAWALLAIQALDAPALLLRARIPELGSAAPSGDFSILGWLATLLLFALAQVYDTGAAMQDDLAGTV